MESAFLLLGVRPFTFPTYLIQREEMTSTMDFKRLQPSTIQKSNAMKNGTSASYYKGALKSHVVEVDLVFTLNDTFFNKSVLKEESILMNSMMELKTQSELLTYLITMASGNFSPYLVTCEYIGKNEYVEYGFLQTINAGFTDSNKNEYKIKLRIEKALVRYLTDFNDAKASLSL